MNGVRQAIVHCLCRRLAFLLALGPLSASCCLAEVPQQDPAERQIEQLIRVQAEAWNRGDLEAFMDGYWKSDQLSFSSGGKVLRGWQATLDRYRQRYGSGAELGKLRLDNLQTSLLGENAAMVLGQWHLQHQGELLEGNFTLVLRRIDGEWKIIHDHTSRLEKEDEPGEAERMRPLQ